MIPLNFPNVDCKVKFSESRAYIFDALRKKYILMTPEEWVRQHLIHWLYTHLGYPKSLMQIEKGYINPKNLKRRTDLLVRDTHGNALLLCECKAAEISLNEISVRQAVVYNEFYNAPWIMVTNGLKHVYLHRDQKLGKYVQWKQLPTFSQLIEK